LKAIKLAYNYIFEGFSKILGTSDSWKHKNCLHLNKVFPLHFVLAVLIY